MVEEMSKIGKLAQMCAFPKVHTKDEQRRSKIWSLCRQSHLTLQNAQNNN